MVDKPKLAVWKFASCDGCQLSLLDCEDELLQLVEIVQIANFPEASKRVMEGPYDISLVEGSVTNEHDRERIQEVRKQSKLLITIGACATAGGIQALRNFANVAEYKQIVYPHPEYISCLATSTPISQHVPVDYELHGCPINARQLLEVLTSFVRGKKPAVSSASVCNACKIKGNICVTVAYGIPCLGPVTHYSPLFKWYKRRHSLPIVVCDYPESLITGVQHFKSSHHNAPEWITTYLFKPNLFDGLLNDGRELVAIEIVPSYGTNQV